MDTTRDEEQRRLHDLQCWHILRFVDLGFNHWEAETLELARVDWHDADDLISAGCPHKIAILILI